MKEILGKNNIPLTFGNDGVKYINTYSKGRTELGKMLSNFYHAPIITNHGLFHTIEGYWQWLRDPNKNNKFRYMDGITAKRSSKFILDKCPIDDEFKSNIANAIGIKILNTPEIYELCSSNELPFEHYYTTDEGGILALSPKDYWFLDAIEEAAALTKLF